MASQRYLHLSFGLVCEKKFAESSQVLLLLMMFICAILLTTFLGKLDSTEVQNSFGTLDRTMWSLFAVITLDGWQDLVEPAAEADGPWVYFFFLLFVLVIPYGLMNILVGVIVETTFEIARNDTDKAERKAKKDAAIVREALKTVRLLGKRRDRHLLGKFSPISI